MANACFKRGRDLFLALVVAVKRDPGRRHTGTKDDRQLTAGADVDAEALIDDPARHCRTEERLGGVVDVPTVECRSEGSGPASKIRLVHHVSRCADLLGELPHAYPSHDQLSIRVFAHAGTPQLRQQGVHILRQAEPARSTSGDVGVDRARDMAVGHALSSLLRK